MDLKKMIEIEIQIEIERLWLPAAVSCPSDIEAVSAEVPNN